MVAMGLTGLVPSQANVASVSQNAVVSADPVDTTPHVKDGKVLSILPMGDRVYVGGTFTQVRNDSAAGSGADCPGTLVDRKGLFAIKKNAAGHWCVDPTFVFNIDGVTQGGVDPVTGEETGENRGVQAIVAGADGQSIYVAGDWTGGGNKLIKINTVASTHDTTFKSGITSAVKDIVRSGDRIFAAGKFKYVVVDGAQVPRFGLASLDAATGALRDDLDIAFTVPRQGTEARVEGLAISPDGKTLVAGGNFTKVDGTDRWQVALLDVTPGQDASIINWQTNRYNDTKTDDPGDTLACAEKFDTHIKDLDISPDGTYFVVVTTGGYTSRGPLCDAAARWELNARGADLQPTWADWDGGDSFTGVTVTGGAVYASGHMRWMNNFHNEGSSTDAVAGPGSVVREGIVALDPVSGLPLAWAPGRERGHGAEALVATSEGLWVGSDTNFIGNRDFDGSPRQGELHEKLAFFPLEGGFVPVTHTTQQLPADLYSVGASGISSRYLSSTQVGAGTNLSSGINWSGTKGAFTIDDRLYTGRSDGKLIAYTFNGTQLGQPQEVPLRGLSGTDFPVSSLTGMFYDKGRLYFTKKATNKLYYRHFLPGATVADDIVGDLSVEAEKTTKVDWTKVEGMTMASGELFWAEGNTLKAATFADGKVTGSARTVGTSAGLAGGGLFLRPATSTPPASIDPPGVPPVTPPVGINPSGSGRTGYWMVGSDGRVYPFGDAVLHGEATPHLGPAKAVDLEPTPTFNGYWIVDDLGRVFAFGDAKAGLGNVDQARLLAGEKVTSLSATPSGNGYWIFTTRGRALTFGDAAFLGDVSALKLNGAVLDSIPTPSGKGYYMVAADGGIFAFGDAAFHGSMGGTKLNAPVQSLVPDSDGVGYWLVASDGGIFAFKANFRGSMGDRKLNKPVTGMVRYFDGYLMVGEDGGIFNFSSAEFKGSLGNNPPAKPIVSVAAVND